MTPHVRLSEVSRAGIHLHHDKEWKEAWLSAGITWKCVGDDMESLFWQAANIREAVGEAFESLYYTPVTCFKSFNRIVGVLEFFNFDLSVTDSGTQGTKRGPACFPDRSFEEDAAGEDEWRSEGHCQGLEGPL